jgi:hypothetical protein
MISYYSRVAEVEYNNFTLHFYVIKVAFCYYEIYRNIQSTVYQNIHFSLCTALIVRALALLLNCKCTT